MGKARKRRARQSSADLWAEHTRRVERAIARFTICCMSNAKWRKAFRLLAAPELGVTGYRWKFVDSERVYATGVVGTEDLEERHLRDGRFQPFVYKEIHWLEVLTPAPDRAKAVLADAGKFLLEPSDVGFRLFGYR